MRCDDYIDRLYTVEELKQEYLKGRIEAMDEFYKTKEEIYKKGFMDAIGGVINNIVELEKSNRERTNGFFNINKNNMEAIEFACILISQNIINWAETKFKGE